ncbi:hypothetical protein DMO17_13965 [Aquipseudomonas alcaligenes]|uniref:Uncharacterized protein n=1 Tax=Aquipseudomonas alcaligenes TaxID=43263 RepID=A0A2V4L8Q3_AQUAC|nr:hypothetical protein DMO17_13965 [Pseudomonas alcaligenes]
MQQDQRQSVTIRQFVLLLALLPTILLWALFAPESFRHHTTLNRRLDLIREQAEARKALRQRMLVAAHTSSFPPPI